MIWNIEKCEIKHCLQGHTSEVVAVSFTADQATIASLNSFGHVILWDVEQGTQITALEQINRHVDIVFNRDGDRLLALR